MSNTENVESESRKQSRQRAREKFRALIAEVGGTLSENQAAARLGISIEDLQQRTSQGTVISIIENDVIQYPVFQFSENGLVDGLRDVLDRLGTDGVIPRCRFLLCHDEDLKGLMRIDALKDPELKPYVLRAAEQFGEQGAS